jgi:hypothetical protein
VERVDIDEAFVRDLVRDQHLELADLEIRPVPSGWDNQLWRLGNELAVRLPMTERAPALLRKEFRWLPELATRLPLPIPTPQHFGEPTARFPKPWIIAKWVPGEPADGAQISDVHQSVDNLAQFLRALHQPAPQDAPTNAGRSVPIATPTDMEELIRRLCELRSTGVRIALDDFGAGYSSLGQLRNLPVDILKIDHALVAEPESRTGTAAPLVDVVVRLGHRLGLEVLAEGIGTPAQREIVVEAGCRLGQGSLFGWGVPAEHLEAQLETARSSGARPAPPQRTRPAAPPSAPARSQVIMLGPGMRQVRALLPTDPAFSADDVPRPGDQDVRSVDAPREMGQS